MHPRTHIVKPPMTCYGGMAIAAPQLITLTNKNTPTKIGGFSANLLRNFSVANSQLLHTGPHGCFLFNGSSDIRVDAASTITFELYKNGNPTGCTTPHTFTSPAKTSHIGITTLVELNGDFLEVFCYSDTDGIALTVQTLSINAVRVCHDH